MVFQVRIVIEALLADRANEVLGSFSLLCLFLWSCSGIEREIEVCMCIRKEEMVKGIEMVHDQKNDTKMERRGKRKKNEKGSKEAVFYEYFCYHTMNFLLLNLFFHFLFELLSENDY